MNLGPRIEVEYVGPFESTRVIVDGRRVPYLEATHMGDLITLTLDERFDLDLTVAEAEKVVPWIADLIAIALGYSCFPRKGQEPQRHQPFPRCIEITSVHQGETDA